MIRVPLSRPPVDDEIKQAVLAAIESRQYVLGPQCRQLETELATATGVKHAVLTSSATAALWLSLRALGVKAGDEVLVPSHTAFPTIEAICAAEATPVFVDADAFYTLDPADAETKATPRTVGILPVHLYGQPVDLGAVQDLASRLGLWLLEDCAQAQGAEWKGRRVGSFGRAAVFSFYPSKNLPGMGDGGAVLTSDDEVMARCRRLRDHGRIDRDVHAEIGFNLRYNELQAAALRVLLRRLDAMNDRRRLLAERYARGLAGLPLVLPEERPHARHVYHLFVVRTPRRAALASFLNERGIQTGVHYPVPSHRQPALERRAPAPLPRTETLVDEILTLPMSAEHADTEIDRVIATVRDFFEA
jgi:dTDP-4-amino-4,6-dideoxygalactose transaminase